MNTTSKTWKLIALGLALALILVVALGIGGWVVTRVYAQRPWGGYGGYGAGPGMMGGWGYGGSQGCGMMGLWGGTYPEGAKTLTMDEAEAAIERSLEAWNNTDLIVDEVMEFSNHFYAVVQEKSTGTGAFEVLVDKVTGAVYSEPGPNMMWNLKYGMMGGCPETFCRTAPKRDNAACWRSQSQAQRNQRGDGASDSRRGKSWSNWENTLQNRCIGSPFVGFLQTKRHESAGKDFPIQFSERRPNANLDKSAPRPSAEQPQRETTQPVGDPNPRPSEINAEMERLAVEYSTPPIVIQTICWNESKWKHFEKVGNEWKPKEGPTHDFGLMQVTEKDAANFPEYADWKTNWRTNLRLSVRILVEKKWPKNEVPESAGKLILENWYYPIAWYNGEGAKAYKYVGDVYALIRNPPPQIAQFCRVVDIGWPRSILGWDEKTIKEEGNKAYQLTQIVQAGGRIHRWNGKTGSALAYEEVTTQYAVSTPQPVGTLGPTTPASHLPESSSELPNTGADIVGKWVHDRDPRLGEIVTLQFERGGTVLMVGPLGNVRIRTVDCSSGEWELDQGNRVSFCFTEQANLKASAQIEDDKLTNFTTGGVPSGVTLIKGPNAQRLDTTSQIAVWNEYVSERSSAVTTLTLRIRRDRSFLAVVSVSHRWRLLNDGSVQVYLEGEKGDVMEHSTFTIKGDRLIDKVCGASYRRIATFSDVQSER